MSRVNVHQPPDPPKLHTLLCSLHIASPTHVVTQLVSPPHENAASPSLPLTFTLAYILSRLCIMQRHHLLRWIPSIISAYLQVLSVSVANEIQGCRLVYELDVRAWGSILTRHHHSLPELAWLGDLDILDLERASLASELLYCVVLYTTSDCNVRDETFARSRKSSETGL